MDVQNSEESFLIIDYRKMLMQTLVSMKNIVKIKFENGSKDISSNIVEIK